MVTDSDLGFTRTLPVGGCDLSLLRRQFVDWLDHQGIEALAQEDWRLILSELATNAVSAASPSSEVEVDADCSDGSLTLQVTNRTDEVPALFVSSLAEPLADHGRGLPIVQRLTDGLTIATEPHQVSVTCWRRAPESLRR